MNAFILTSLILVGIMLLVKLLLLVGFDMLTVVRGIFISIVIGIIYALIFVQ